MMMLTKRSATNRDAAANRDKLIVITTVGELKDCTSSSTVNCLSSSVLYLPMQMHLELVLVECPSKGDLTFFESNTKYSLPKNCNFCFVCETIH